jgi:4-amino-4-deoxy-L-arabinose transferase-like glycosyltransferase
VYRLGADWLDRPIGLLAAFLVMTSAPVLSNGLRAYIDIPYMVFVLAALLIETRRPRAGWPVLVLLALAGLLRPEAWLFAGFYFLYLALDFHLSPKDRSDGPVHDSRPGVGIGRMRIRLRAGGIDRNLVLMACLAAAGPVIWVLFDLVTTGNALYSFTGTRETVETLERDTGPADVVLYGPRRLGEVMQWPGMVGALFGVLLCLRTMPRRVMLGLAAAVAALVAFAIMGAAGLAIIPRYTMLAASILFIFAAASVLGWRLLEPGDRWRRPWQAVAVLVVLLYVAWLPNQYDLLSKVDRDLSNQSLVERDLEALVDDGAFVPPDDPGGDAGVESCLPISVPNHRAVPRLAFWLDIRPRDVVSVAAAAEQPDRGFFLAPARDFTVENFILDPGEPGRAVTRPPPGFELVAENRSWKLYTSCASG